MNAVCKKAVPILNYRLSDVVMFASSFQDVIYLHISPQIQNRQQEKNKNKNKRSPQKSSGFTLKNLKFYLYQWPFRPYLACYHVGC